MKEREQCGIGQRFKFIINVLQKSHQSTYGDHWSLDSPSKLCPAKARGPMLINNWVQPVFTRRHDVKQGSYLQPR